MTAVTIYTDGSCEPNPGRGGWGAVLLYADVAREASGPIVHATNNQAELIAAIEALRLLKRPCAVLVISDSQWLVRCASGQYQRSANSYLWAQLDQVITNGGHTVEWRWVRAHSGNRWNERANALAFRAMRTGAA